MIADWRRPYGKWLIEADWFGKGREVKRFRKGREAD
jgi:hypothetical protein